MTITRASGQQVGNFADNATSVSKAYTNNVVAGNLLIIGAIKFSPSNDVFVAEDCTKSAGTATVGTISLHAQTSLNDGGDYLNIAIWSAIVTGSGSCTMQVGGAVAGTYLSMALDELVSTLGWDSSRLEASNTATGTTGAPTTSNVASAGSANFVGVLTTNAFLDITVTEDGAFTLIYEDQNGSLRPIISFIERIVSTGTTDAASWTAPTTYKWLAGVAVFKEVATATSILKQIMAHEGA